jgi:hypothetical protein
MKTHAEQVLERALEEVAADARRHPGGVARGALLQRMVAEVQARTGVTVPVALVEAWFDAAEERAGEEPEEAVDPWDDVDARIDAARVV